MSGAPKLLLTVERSDGYSARLFRLDYERHAPLYFIRRQPMLGPPRDGDGLSREIAFAEMRAEVSALLDTENL